jgi:hypothetical protein
MPEESRNFYSDPSVIASPRAYFDAMRAKYPVQREQHFGTIMVTGYDEAVEVLTNKDSLFSNAASVVGPIPGLPFEPAAAVDKTVSIEDYSAYMGELIGVEPKFEYTETVHTPMWPDTTYMHEVLGRTKVGWKEGMRRTIKALHPELKLTDE